MNLRIPILPGLLLCAAYHAAAMTSEPTMIRINSKLLPYNAQLESRSITDISLLVIHCTELPDLATARDYGERIHYPESGTGNSGHYYIERDGSIHQWVEPDRVAHHVAGHNADSIGIELVNLGRYPDWHHSEHQTMTQAYPEEQLKALVTLVSLLKDEIPNLEYITGHQDLDQRKIAASDRPQLEISRKLDPGPLFPWERLLLELGLKKPVVR
jgi:N-acetylmuramoyl-L-alanine amidase